MRTAQWLWRFGPRSAGRKPARVAAVLLGAQLLAACSSSGSGPPSLNLYIYPDGSGAVQQAVDNCTKASGGRYAIKYQKLPNSADGQRQQMVRRLAARDSSLDILGLDVTWAPEFAGAGWIQEWTGNNKAQVQQGTLAGPLQTASYNGKLYAAPFNSNTQLLWYRSDLVPTPPKTWDEMLSMSAALAQQGKPHYIEIQGNQYEGITVWFNTLLASAGGGVLTPDGKGPALGPPAVTALTIMKNLASSPAADPSLSVQMENDNRLAMESGTAAFQLNYPFVYPSMKKDQPKLFQSFKWAAYPAVSTDQPTHVTIGGINLAVSSYSKHSDLAFEATLCLRNRDNQKIGATVGGTPPSISDLYDDPSLQADYPFRKDIQASLATAAVRPLTPAYQNLSIVISHAVSPPGSINPSSTEKKIASQVKAALASKGLIP
jgi:multiple sugar transport system substrate-binding protein